MELELGMDVLLNKVEVALSVKDTKIVIEYHKQGFDFQSKD